MPSSGPWHATGVARPSRSSSGAGCPAHARRSVCRPPGGRLSTPSTADRKRSGTRSAVIVALSTAKAAAGPSGLTVVAARSV